MKIELICIEKTKKTEYKNIIQDYLKRINKKLNFTIKEIPFVNPNNIKKENALTKQLHLIKKYINEYDYVVLLDENGKSYSSLDFSKWLNFKISSMRNVYDVDLVLDELLYHRIQSSQCLQQPLKG